MADKGGIRMNSRERVLCTLKHREPDRVPYDIGATDSSGITAAAYNRLRKFAGLGQGKTQIIDTYGQIVRIEDDMKGLFEPDAVMLMRECTKWKPFLLNDNSACMIPARWNPEREDDGAYTIRNTEGIITDRMPAGGFYFDSVFAPLANVEEISDLQAHAREIESFDSPFYADESLNETAARARRFFEDGSLAVVANLGGHLLAAGQALFGYERFMMDLLADKKMAHAFLDMLTNAYMERYDRYLDRIAGFIQVVLVNDDLGMQSGPLISLECYKEMIWPYQKKLFEFIKKKTDVSILVHSCGSVNQYIPLLIEAGVDALNPVQVSANGMDTKMLKREFGRDITFWGGGCDTQRVLWSGTPGQVREEVKRRMEDLAPGGGFVFTQVHNIQPEVPPENIMAMLEAFKQYRDY